jgi:hypothetical protein
MTLGKYIKVQEKLLRVLHACHSFFNIFTTFARQKLNLLQYDFYVYF